MILLKFLVNEPVFNDTKINIIKANFLFIYQVKDYPCRHGFEKSATFVDVVFPFMSSEFQDY